MAMSLGTIGICSFSPNRSIFLKFFVRLADGVLITGGAIAILCGGPVGVILGEALIAAGINGLLQDLDDYDVPNDKYTWKKEGEWGAMVGIGFIFGAIGGALVAGGVVAAAGKLVTAGGARAAAWVGAKAAPRVGARIAGGAKVVAQLVGPKLSILTEVFVVPVAIHAVVNVPRGIATQATKNGFAGKAWDHDLRNAIKSALTAGGIEDSMLAVSLCMIASADLLIVLVGKSGLHAAREQHKIMMNQPPEEPASIEMNQITATGRRAEEDPLLGEQQVVREPDTESDAESYWAALYGDRW
jgi:hypothetical protein